MRWSDGSAAKPLAKLIDTKRNQIIVLNRRGVARTDNRWWPVIVARESVNVAPMSLFLVLLEFEQ
jgi:hypothetical protein